VEFMAALLSHDSDDSDKTLKNLTECRKQSIQVLPPDINESNAGFTVVKQRIRYGLGALKGIGDKVVQSILHARATEPFADIEDFLGRVDPKAFNRKALESLIKCGSFDYSKVSRRELFEAIDELISLAQTFQRDQQNGQGNLFAPRDGTPAKIVRRRFEQSEWSIIKKLSFEREALGSYISGHPLERYRKGLARIALSTQQLRSRKKGDHVSVAGVVTTLKLKNTKKGDRYASFVLEDELGTVDALVWPDNYNKLSEILSGDNPVLCKGKADISEERCTLIIDTVILLETIRNKQVTTARLRLDENQASVAQLTKLKGILENFPGNIPIFVMYARAGSMQSVTLPLLVEPSDDLSNAVEELYGRPVLIFS